jgi:hypothetical protein
MSKRIHKQKENPTPEKSIRNNEKEEEGKNLVRTRVEWERRKLKLHCLFALHMPGFGTDSL